MKTCNTILTEKQQNYRQGSSGKTNKYEYLTGEGKLPFDKNRNIEPATFTYSTPFIFYSTFKAFEKQIKTIEDRGKNQVEALKALKPEEKKTETFPKNIRNNEIKNKIAEIKK